MFACAHQIESIHIHTFWATASTGDAEKRDLHAYKHTHTHTHTHTHARARAHTHTHDSVPTTERQSLKVLAVFEFCNRAFWNKMFALLSTESRAFILRTCGQLALFGISKPIMYLVLEEASCGQTHLDQGK